MSAARQRDGRLWRALESLSDTFVVGLLAWVVSLPLVTLPAALAAARIVLGDDAGGGSVISRFRDALRPRLRAGALLGTAALVVTLIGVIDVLWALSAPLTFLRSAVLAVGVLLVAGACSVALTGCAQLADGAHDRVAVSAHDIPARGRTDPPSGQFRGLLHSSALTAAAKPHSVLPLVVLGACGFATAVVVPVLAPLVLGVAARCLRWAPALRINRLSTSPSSAEVWTPSRASSAPLPSP